MEEEDSAKMRGYVHKNQRAAINGNGLHAMDSTNSEKATLISRTPMSREKWKSTEKMKILEESFR